MPMDGDDEQVAVPTCIIVLMYIIRKTVCWPDTWVVDLGSGGGLCTDTRQAGGQQE